MLPMRNVSLRRRITKAVEVDLQPEPARCVMMSGCVFVIVYRAMMCVINRMWSAIITESYRHGKVQRHLKAARVQGRGPAA